MALVSTYVFDQSDLRGNFTFNNAALLFTSFAETTSSTDSSSVLTVNRENGELLVDLYIRFNQTDFLSLIDIAPLISGPLGGEQYGPQANPEALLYLVSYPLDIYAYRTSDIRAGWDQWRFIPYHDKQPSRHGDSDVLNQLAFNFHNSRGPGVVDNDGWIAFYYTFSLDAAGRLRAFVDGCAYEFGGEDAGLSDRLNAVLPSFMSTIQSFLDQFCADVALFQPGEHDANGHPLFDHVYLLPGDGDSSLGTIQQPGGVPLPGAGSGMRSIDVEVSLAVLPKQKFVPPRPPGSNKLSIAIVAEVARELESEGWIVKVSKAREAALTGSRVINGRNVEITARLGEASNATSHFARAWAAPTKVKSVQKKTGRATRGGKRGRR
jgi:hypothetical protein